MFTHIMAICTIRLRTSQMVLASNCHADFHSILYSEIHLKLFDSGSASSSHDF